jgi:hypothetical protein
MKAAVDSGYNVCIISGSNEGVRVRLRNLGITDIHRSKLLTNIRCVTTLSQNKYCIWRRYPGLPCDEISRITNLPSRC